MSTKMDCLKLVSIEMTHSSTNSGAAITLPHPTYTEWNCSTTQLPSGHHPTLNIQQSTPRFNVLVTDEMYAYFDIYLQFWALFLVSCFGLVSNSLNVMVLTRQGFKEGVNVTLMAISCWDILKCIATFTHRIYGPLSLFCTACSTSWRNFTFPYIEYTPLVCSYICCSLATYISIERCICVKNPFTVKSTFTPKFTLIMVSLISAIVGGAFSIVYFIYSVLFVYSPAYNATIAIYTYSQFFYNYQHIFMVYYKCAAILVPFVAYIIMSISTIITVNALRRSSSFIRQQETSKALGNVKARISLRERQVHKMLLTVVIINIGNMLARSAYYVAQLAEPEFYLLRRYHNLVLVVSEVLFVLSFTVSSFNFFIFLSMSSNYRSTFQGIFNTKKNDV